MPAETTKPKPDESWDDDGALDGSDEREGLDDDDVPDLEDTPDPEVRPNAPPLRSQADAALEEIVSMNRAIRKAHVSFQEADKAAKAKKKTWEGLVEELQELIESQDQLRLPFPSEKPSEPTPPVETDELWRTSPIDHLRPHGLSEAIVEKLDDGGFHTIGDLANWTAGDNRLTAIHGIGQAKAEAIEKALEGFWAAWGKSIADDVLAHSYAVRDAGLAREHLERIDAEANGTQPVPSSVSFSGSDFDHIAAAGKELRKRGRKGAKP